MAVPKYGKVKNKEFDMRKLFLSILFLSAATALFAAAQGTTCSNPIPLGDNFSANISGPYPRSVWYSAWTFDLPLTVYFAPEHETDPAPDVEMDFKCPNGVYEDSILCSLFCPNSGSGGVQFDMPHHPSLSTDRLEDGTFVYYLSLGKKYRDLLLQMGISSNLEVYVKVTYKGNGTMSMAPDDMFTNCMDGPKFMHLGDTVRVKTQDVDRHVIMPYIQWQEDSIRYVWNGTDPVTIAISAECDFDPTDNSDGRILDFVTLQPQDTLKLTSAEVKYYINSDEVTSQAGMFFAKFYTNGTGVMKIERVPQAPPDGGATLLKLDKVTTVPADPDALYAIPFTWDTAIVFTTPTDHVFTMYIGTTYDFTPQTAIATYHFHANDDGHWWGVTTEQMRALWAQTTAQYLYIRIECTAKTTIKPSIWEIPDCQKSTTEILRPSTTLSVQKGSYGAVYYRFYYREWKGGKMKFAWSNSNGTCPTFIGDNCTFSASASNQHVITNKAIAKNGSWTILETDVADWEEYVDADGFLYIRFNPGNPGTMKITTTAPEEQDPAPIVYPARTIHVVCNGEPSSAGQEYSIRVSTAQTLQIDGGTPWNQTPEETQTVTLQSGVHTLQGATESVQIDVK